MKLGSTPFIAWHRDGDTAWIDLLFVPREQRHRGHGAAMVAAVLRALPAGIREIEVLAAQLDDELALGFWTKLGFEPEMDLVELGSGTYLRKRVAPGAAEAVAAAGETVGRGIGTGGAAR